MTEKLKPRPRCLPPAAGLVIGAVLGAGAVPLEALEVSRSDGAAFATAPPGASLPGQLPHSRVARGTADIAAAWLAGATDRYAHAVLGDALEASVLAVRRRDGEVVRLGLPVARVFEDLEPRLADLDGDGRDEILLVESDATAGASLAVYGLVAGRLVKRAATPFLGRPYRWLNPLGVGDFDGDGRADIALVATPHIGGVLRLFHFTPPILTQFAETRDVSTHRMGSPELGLGRVIAGAGRDRLLVPDQRHQSLMVYEWDAGRLRMLARADLPAPLASALYPVPGRANRWRLRLADGSYREVAVP